MNFLEQETGDSPLHLALRYKRKIDAENHLRRGADPNFPNAHGDTPLHIICRRISDSSDLAKMVFELSDKSYYPVQVNAQNDLDETPLHLAISCMYNSKKMVELLLRMGANPNLANAKGSTPLHIISKKCYTDDLVSLIFRFRDERYHPVQVDAMDEEGNTPLHVALKESNKEAARSLLKNGADPNLATTYGLTPLYICCDRQSDIGLADMLFKICDDKQRPVDVDATNRWNNTPLHAAAFHDHKDLVKLLITRGADPNIANLRGSTPLHWICAKCCDTDVAKIFFAVCDEKHRSVQVNVRDNLGRTPLELALYERIVYNKRKEDRYNESRMYSAVPQVAAAAAYSFLMDSAEIIAKRQRAWLCASSAQFESMYQPRAERERERKHAHLSLPTDHRLSAVAAINNAPSNSSRDSTLRPKRERLSGILLPLLPPLPLPLLPVCPHETRIGAGNPNMILLLTYNTDVRVKNEGEKGFCPYFENEARYAKLNDTNRFLAKFYLVMHNKFSKYVKLLK
ncbi:unnamed protein product [Trichogramma brassicae]|uniref:Uncharacterized protein n=1 Tax=Trichogramma brassicae TaxID=86971 RepID=A0A6H5J2P3_9HYME|nr:unnamed protein product [Trichogramma brassicae]